MTNEKKVINPNTTDNNQGENTAPNSGNNPAISLDELTEREAYFYYQKLENDLTESIAKSKFLGAEKNYDLARIEHKKQNQIFTQQETLNEKWDYFLNFEYGITKQLAEQSNEVIPVIPETAEKDEVIEVVEDVILVIPKKDKGKSKAVELEDEPENTDEKERKIRERFTELENFQGSFFARIKPEPTQPNNDFIPFIPIYTEYKQPDEPQEPEQPEASSSTQTNEQQKELSAESQQIIKLVNELLISEPTEPSGNQVETIFAPEIKTFPEPKLKILKVISKAERKLLGPVKINNTNRLYKLKPDKRQELIGKFSGLDKVIAEKLAEKVGTRQESTPLLLMDHIVGSISPTVPFLGIAPVNQLLAQRDNLHIELEKSFSITEVKEIVRKSNHETHEKLKGVENLLIRMEESQESLISENSKELGSKDAEIKKLKQQALDFIVKKQEIETQIAEALGQNKKLLASKEKVDLDTITEKYRILEQNATQREELLELKDREITEFIQLINYQEQEKEILGGEFSILGNRVLRIEAEKLLLDSELFAKSNELELKELQFNNRIKEKNTEIKHWSEKWTEWENRQKDLEAQSEDYRQKWQAVIIQRDDWEKKFKQANQKARIGLLSNVLQGAVNYLPIPKNYRELAKTSIQTGSAYLIIKDLPNWTYEALIALITLIVFFSLRALKRKFWPSQKVSNLEKALEKVIVNTKNSVQEVKQIITEQSEPEPKNTTEILPEPTETETKENLQLTEEERELIRKLREKKNKTSKKPRPKRTKEPTKEQK